MDSPRRRSRAAILAISVVGSLSAWTPALQAQEHGPGPRTLAFSGSSTSSSLAATNGEVHVDFDSDQSGLRLLVHKQEDESARDQIEEVCPGPCETTMAPGTYRMALSLPNEDTVEANELILHGPSTLKGHVEYRAGTRLALLLLGASIEIVGGILLYQGLSSTHDVCIGVPNVATGFATVQVCHPESSPDTALIAAGALTLAVGLTVGFVRFFGYRDKATIEVIPLTSLLSGLKGVAIEGSRSTVAPEGVGVRVKF